MTYNPRGTGHTVPIKRVGFGNQKYLRSCSYRLGTQAMEESMAGDKKIRAALKSKAPHANSIFGPPPILEGEDATAYDSLLTRLYADLRPIDMIEEIWLREIA